LDSPASCAYNALRTSPEALSYTLLLVEPSGNWEIRVYTMFGDFGERTDAFEQFMTQEIENPAGPALRQATATPEKLTSEEREAIALFMGVAAARTPAMMGITTPAYCDRLPARELHDLSETACLWAKYVGLPEGKDARAEFMKPSAFGAVLIWATSFRDRLLGWDWHFVRTTRQMPFVTSDWPVYAEKDPTSGVRFVQFPISAEIALVANSAGALRQNRDPKEDIKAMNRGTLQQAREFVVSCGSAAADRPSVALPVAYAFRVDMLQDERRD